MALHLFSVAATGSIELPLTEKGRRLQILQAKEQTFGFGDLNSDRFTDIQEATSGR